jgi:hypothetical protein
LLGLRLEIEHEVGLGVGIEPGERQKDTIAGVLAPDGHI